MVPVDCPADPLMDGGQLVVRRPDLPVKSLEGYRGFRRVNGGGGGNDFGRIPVCPGPVRMGAFDQRLRCRLILECVRQPGEFNFDFFADVPIGRRSHMVLPLSELIDRRQRLPDEDAQALKGGALFPLAQCHVVE